MARNILIFSDGTGQAGGLFFDERRSNVYKLYRATRVCPDSSIDPADQIAFYDAGLGSTPPSGGGVLTTLYRRVYNLVSQATGLGLTANMIDCYAFLVRFWQPGDRIFLFGFSRGAYTVRCLGGVLALCGIPTAESGAPLKRDPATARRIAGRAVRDVYQYTSSRPPGLASPRQALWLRQRAELARRFRAAHGAEAGGEANAHPYFIGVFDTVASIAVTGAVLLVAVLALVLLGAAAGALAWLTGLSFACAAGGLALFAALGAGVAYLRTHLKWAEGVEGGFWASVHLTPFRQRFYDTDLHPRVPYARHAIAIDENRADFARVKWGSPRARVDPADEADIQRFEQIWFVGVHSDVGGGYEESESRLSDIALRWMVDAAMTVPDGIRVDAPTLRTYPAPDGMQHDQVKAAGRIVAWLLRRLGRVSTRAVPEDAVLHPSVYRRLALPAVQLYDVTAPYRPAALAGHHGARGHLERLAGGDAG